MLANGYRQLRILGIEGAAVTRALKKSFASTRYRPLLRVYNCRSFRYAAGSCCLNVKAKGMGLLIKALLGALVVVLIGVLSKTKELLYRRVNSALSDFRPDRELYRCQRAGCRSAANHHRLWDGGRSSVLYLFALAMVFHRHYAPAVRSGRRSGVLVPLRVAVNYRLEPFSLAQVAAAVDGK